MDAARTRLCELVKTTGQRLRYLYDLDCAWDHELVLDELFCVSGEKPEDASYDVPDVLGGERACPPEDGAGIPDDPMAEHTPGRRKDGGKGTADYAAFLRSYHPGGAPGGRNREKMLEILATIEPTHDIGSLDAMREAMQGHAISLSAAILIFTEWCGKRADFVKALGTRGVHTIVLVVTEDRRVSLSGLTFLPVGEIEGLLATLPLSLHPSTAPATA